MSMIAKLLFRARVSAATKLIAEKRKRVGIGLITRSAKKARERFRKPIKVTLVQDFWVHPGDPPSVYFAQNQSGTQVRVEDPKIYAQVMRAFEEKRRVAQEIIRQNT